MGKERNFSQYYDEEWSIAVYDDKKKIQSLKKSVTGS